MAKIIIFLSVVFILFFIFAFIITFKRSWILNLIIWGGFSSIIFSPIIGFESLKIAQYVTNDRWAGMLGIYTLLFLEIISIVLIVIGCVGFIIKKLNTIKFEDGEKGQLHLEKED